MPVVAMPDDEKESHARLLGLELKHPEVVVTGVEQVKRTVYLLRLKNWIIFKKSAYINQHKGTSFESEWRCVQKSIDDFNQLNEIRLCDMPEPFFFEEDGWGWEI